MKTKIIIALTCFTFITSNAFALGPLYLDFHGSAGYGGSAVKGETTSPKVIQYSAGTTLGYNMAFMYIGASADYSMVNQLTEPNSTFGNRGGKKLNLASPTIGFKFPFIKIKFDYQLMGTYTLTKKTSSGSIVKYEDPAGFRGYIGMPYSSLMDIGLFYESVTYKTEFTGTSEKTLTTKKITLSQAGLMAVISF